MGKFSEYTYEGAVKLRLIKHELLIEISNNGRELRCHAVPFMTPHQPEHTLPVRLSS
jgi:hypothetical protein